MEIQRAEADDLTEILELQKLCFQEIAKRYNDFKMQPITQTLKEVKAEFKRGVVLKAIEGGMIVGSARAYEEAGSCHIGKVIVLPAQQNKGIATKLMTAIEAAFPNVSKYELFTGNKDEKNIYLYGKLGYCIVKKNIELSDPQLIAMEKPRK